MDTIIYVVGPTAVGKTNLATYLGQTFQGNLISADSIQVYRGLDIISGKDIDIDSQFSLVETYKNLRIGTHLINKVPIWGLDVVEGSYPFSVSDFYQVSERIIEKIRDRRIMPIVVGGTTLYVNSLINPIQTINVRFDQELRNSLEEKSLAELHHQLDKIAHNVFVSLNKSELANKRRIIRKLEIALLQNKSNKTIRGIRQKPIVIGLTCERENLKKRIDIRVEERILNGALDEVDQLFNNYHNLVPQIQNANGYKQLFMFFQGKYSKEEAIQRWKFSEYRHAKNQMTYFKKYLNVEWFDIQETNVKDIENVLIRKM